ncbi:hypothetical protein AAG906_026490 [Vitis piasezkii]
MPEAIHPTTPLTHGAPPPYQLPQTSSFISSPLSPWPLFGHTRSDHCYSAQIPGSFIDSARSEYATPFGHDRSAPSEPLVPDDESLPAEQPIPEEEIRAEPSHDPTHI